MQFSSIQKRVEARYFLLSLFGSSKCTDSSLSPVGIEDNCKNLPYFPFSGFLLV